MHILPGRQSGKPDQMSPIRAAVPFLPGIPKLLVHLFAGLSGMHLRIFLLFDILGAALITGIVVGLGHAMGETAVDLVLLMDKYALYVTVGILAVAGYMAGSAARKRRSEVSRGAG